MVFGGSFGDFAGGVVAQRNTNKEQEQRNRQLAVNEFSAGLQQRAQQQAEQNQLRGQFQKNIETTIKQISQARENGATETASRLAKSAEAMILGMSDFDPAAAQAGRALLQTSLTTRTPTELARSEGEARALALDAALGREATLEERARKEGVEASTTADKLPITVRLADGRFAQVRPSEIPPGAATVKLPTGTTVDANGELVDVAPEDPSSIGAVVGPIVNKVSTQGLDSLNANERQALELGLATNPLLQFALSQGDSIAGLLGGGGLPEGIPEGSKLIGRDSSNNPVYETPDGKRLVVE